MPEALQNAPQLYPWLGVFYMAFHELIADRHWQDGPIPWAVRQQWAEAHGLDDTATSLLHTHVKALDLAFLKWRAAQKPATGQRTGRQPPSEE